MSGWWRKASPSTSPTTGTDGTDGTDGLWMAREHAYDAIVLDAGADDYLTKASSYAVLLAHVRALIRRVVRERPAVLEVGGLRLDRAVRRVWRGAVEVRLTAREMSPLEFLIEAQLTDMLAARTHVTSMWRPARPGCWTLP